MLAVLVLLLVPTPAQAQNGTITGTVTDAVTGAPIANVPIFIVRAGYFDIESDSNVVAQLFTNAAGQYTFSGPPDRYGVGAIPSEEGDLDYVDEIYDNISGLIGAAEVYDATIITVTPGSSFTANFALERAGRISGTVTNAATGAPLANVEVQAAYRYGSGWYYLNGGRTDAAGNYTIIGLVPGPVYLFVWSNSAAGFVAEVYGDIPCVAGCDPSLPRGTPVTVASNQTTPGANFALDRGGIISGTVTNAVTGAPIQNLIVQVNTFVNGSLTFVTSAATNAAGVYSAGGLATGTYYALTNVGNSGVMNEVYDNIPCPLGCNMIPSGTEIPVKVGEAVSGRNFALDPGGSISGRVTNQATGAGLQNVTVTVLMRVGTSNLTRSATTNATGNYSVNGLPTGTFWAYTSNSAGYINEILGDIPCLGPCSQATAMTSGASIPVTQGANASGRNFALSSGGGITGTVRDAVTMTAIAGHNVELYAMVNNNAQRVFLTSAVTNASGAYGFGALPSGTYFVATAGRTSYRNEMYNGAACPGLTCAGVSGTPIQLTEGTLASGRDFNLERTDLIRGKVTSAATGQPIEGITVNLYQRTGTGVFVDSAVTDQRGGYIFTVANGTYVAFTSNSVGYRNEIYNDIACATSCSAATAVTSGAPIAVTGAGADSAEYVSGINFALDLRNGPPAAPTNFRVVGTGGAAQFAWNAPASSTTGLPTSYVIDAGGSPGGTIVSLPAGSGTSVSVSGVPPGTFYVRLRAINAAGSSPASNEVVLAMSAAGEALPDAPVTVQAFVNGDKLTLTWQAPVQRGGPHASYLVEAGSQSGLANIATIPVTGRSFSYAPVPAGFYFLRVKAVNAGGVSASSTEVMIVVGGVPAPPPAPNFNSHTVNNGTVTLAWATPTSGNPTSYIVEAGSAPSLANLAVANTGNANTTVSFSGVPSGTYYVRLRAVNAQGASVVSSERTIVVP